MKNKNSENKNELKILSTILTRMSLLAGLGQSFGGKRDLYAECGFPKCLTFQDFYNRYRRQGVARTIVDIFPKMTWRMWPEVKDTEKAGVSAFEESWKSLCKSKRLFYYISKADRLSGIGQFGILVMGFNDGATLDKPVEKASELLYLQAYPEGNVSISKFNQDTKSSRYGLPELYQVSITSADGVTTTTKSIHWTRVLHLAEDCESSEIYGTPRMESVFNDLMSLEQLIGGGSEMFWKGAFPGYNFKVDPNAETNAQSLSAIKEEIEKLMHGLQRYIRTKGITAEALAQQVSDPSNFIDALFTSISASKRIPKRILMGSERGELASTQDRDNWLDQIVERQVNYAEPFILRPFIDRLISFGVLPSPNGNKYEIVWPSLFEIDDMKKSEIALKKTQALSIYSSSLGIENIISAKSYLTRILGFTDEEANSFINEANLRNEEFEKQGDELEQSS